MLWRTKRVWLSACLLVSLAGSALAANIHTADSDGGRRRKAVYDDSRNNYGPRPVQPLAASDDSQDDASGLLRPELNPWAIHSWFDAAPGTQFQGTDLVEPVDGSAGKYTYTYLLSLALGDPAAHGPTGFAAMGADVSTQRPLWYLQMLAGGPIASSGDVEIHFSSDPALGLDDAAIVGELADALLIDHGVARLSNYRLFSQSYGLSMSYLAGGSGGSGGGGAGGSILLRGTVANALGGYVSLGPPVPEPGSWVLGLCGAALVGAVGLIRRRNSTTPSR